MGIAEHRLSCDAINGGAGIASYYRVHLHVIERLDRHGGAGHQGHKTQHKKNFPHVVLLIGDRCRWMTTASKTVASE
jgi:hypothetical protein